MADSVPATREARQYRAESFHMTGRLRRLYALLFASTLGLFALLFLAQKSGLTQARPAAHVSPALVALLFGIAAAHSSYPSAPKLRRDRRVFRIR